MIKIPNPGSDDAVDLGCQCPVMDNAHGKGSGYGKDTFWINQECPLHGKDRDNAQKYIQKRAMKRIGL